MKSIPTSRSIITGLLLCILSFSCSSQKIALKTLHVTGRHNLTMDGHIELISSGAYLKYFAKGNSYVKAHVPNGMQNGYVQYSLNNGAAKRLIVKAGDTTQITITQHKDSTALITFLKTTEAKTGPVFVSSISGRHIKPLAPYTANIEFIGNSITCGAASDETMMKCSEGNYHDHHNAYDAYGPRVARALGMGYMLSSVSGIGIYRNWNSNGPTMPQVYESLSLDTADSRIWDSKSFLPHIICIALGTNDFSNGDGKTPRPAFDSAQFVSNYIAFVERIRQLRPQATIALLSSPMLQGEKRLVLERCLTAVKNNSPKGIHTFFYDEMKATGCGGHPNIEEQGLMAEQLLPFIKTLQSTHPRNATY